MPATGRDNRQSLTEPAAASSLWRLMLATFLLTVAIEALTLVLRFAFELESTRDTASTIGWLTAGLRIHHGYCGATLVLVGCGLSQHSAPLSRLLYVVGWALFMSDMFHHFVILWAITGSPQFDLFYPA